MFLFHTFRHTHTTDRELWLFYSAYCVCVLIDIIPSKYHSFDDDDDDDQFLFFRKKSFGGDDDDLVVK